MSAKDWNIEALSEIFSQHGIEAASEQIEGVCEDFAYHLSMMNEMDSYQHIGGKEVNPLQAEVDRLKHELDVVSRALGDKVGSRFLQVSGDTVKVSYDRQFERSSVNVFMD
jgi:hypothetical protein